MGTTPPCGSCPKPFYLDPNNETAFELFQILCTQPRVAGMGTIIGLDLTAFPIACDVKGIPMEERDFLLDKITILGKIAFRYWNKKTEEDE